MNSATEDAVLGLDEEQSTKKGPAERPEKDGSFDETALEGYLIEDNQIASEIVNGLRSNDQNARLDAATTLHRLVDKRETTSTQPITNSGLIPDIVTMINLEDVELHVPLVCILACLTTGSSETLSALVEAGAIAKCIMIASSSASERARNNALLGLGNIGGYSQLLNDTVIEEGGLKPPLDILGNPSEHKDSHRYWAAKAIAQITYLLLDVAVYELHAQDIITVLTKYIDYKQEETAGSLTYSLLALSHISSNVSVIDTVLETGVIPRIVRLCSSEHASARHSALECVANILYSSNGTKHLIKAGIIEALRACLASQDAQDRIYACWAATNIAAITSTLEQAEALMEAGFVPVLVKAISNPAEEAEARSYAAWTLAGLAYNWGQIYLSVRRALLDAGCVEGFLSALALKDQGAVSVSMKSLLVYMETWGIVKQDAIERIKAAGGVSVLRAFKLRPEADLAHERRMAHVILKVYLDQFSLPPRV